MCYYIDPKDNKIKKKDDDMLENNEEVVILDF